MRKQRDASEGRRAKGETGSGVFFAREDLREVLRRDVRNRLVLFLLDCSDSMGLARRISAAKGAALSLLVRSGVTGDRIAVIGFRDSGAQVTLPPTRSVGRARRLLENLQVGGATPMAAGLLESHRLLERDRRLHPSGTRLLVLMSDGEANVPLTKGADVGTEVMALADTTRRLAHRIVVLHTGESDSPLLSRFANEVGGLYRRCDTPASRDVVATLSNSKDIG